ncbi:MAG TPA: hypothetical protein VJ183_15830 [Chloroflexia bacterium]|nr:hypothetical protein [Chloroflexia bacterium]
MKGRIFTRRAMVALLIALASIAWPYGQIVSAQPTLASEGVDEYDHCITGPSKPMQCFDTEAEALYVASGGRIQLAPGETSRSLSDKQMLGDGDAVSVQATLYEDVNYGGSTLTIYADGCIGWNNISGGWNDRVSSVSTYGCDIILYENYNKVGPSLYINYPGTSWVGSSMNDKASSWKLP